MEFVFQNFQNMYHINPAATKVILSSASITFVLNAVSHFCSINISKSYLLDPKMQIEWCTRIVSSIYSSICAVYIFYLFYRDSERIVTDIFYNTFDSMVCICMIIGYLLADICFVLYAGWKNEMSDTKSTIVHHGMGMLCFGTSIYNGIGYPLCLMMLMTEASTPFLNIRWFLYKCNKEDSLIYKLNGAWMTLVFFTVRIAAFPFHCWMVYQHTKTIYDASGIYVTFLTVAGLVVAGCLNHYWFSLMIRGLIKLFKKHNDMEQSSGTVQEDDKKRN